MFKEYNEKYELFHVSEGWLNGNASKLYNGQLDYDTKKSEYISCKFFDDQDCVKRMEMESKNKTDEYTKLYNMTLDQFFVCANAKIANGRIELESKLDSNWFWICSQFELDSDCIRIGTESNLFSNSRIHSFFYQK